MRRLEANGFLVGMMLAPVFVAFAGLPVIFAGVVLPRLSISETAAWLVGVVLAVAVCAWLGVAVARSRFGTWRFALGVAAMPLLTAALFARPVISDPLGQLPAVWLVLAAPVFLIAFGLSLLSARAGAPASQAHRADGTSAV